MTRPRRPTPPSRTHLDETHEAGSRATRTSCGSPASRPCRSTRPTCAGPPSGWRTRSRTAGLEHVEVDETERPPGRLRRLAPRRGRADGPRLRPLRRPAGRPARPVDVAAVRAGHRRRPDARPRRGRRQGPDPRPRDGGGGDPGDPRRLPDQRQVRVRGRGGERLRAASTPGSRPTASGSTADVAIISDTGFFEGNIPAITRQPARPDVRPDRRRRIGRSTCIRAASAAPSRTRPTRWPRSSPRSRAPTAGSGSPGSTTRSWPLTDDEHAAIAELPFDEDDVPRATPASTALVGEAGYSTLERRAHAPDARRQRHLGRLPGRRHQDDHPGPRARQGQLPARADQDPRDIFEKFRDFVLAIAPPGRQRSRSRTSAAGGPA